MGTVYSWPPLNLHQTSLEFTSKMKLFIASLLAVAAVHSQPTAEANPAPWYGYYGYRWPAYHYGYYGKRSADAEATGAAEAEPVAEADAKPWWYGNYGYYAYPSYGYGYYGKRSADPSPKRKRGKKWRW